VLYLFDIDLVERNALWATAELPLLDVQTEIARLNGFREARMVRQPRWLARELWPMVAAAGG
jgi:hypothetical protein